MGKATPALAFFLLFACGGRTGLDLGVESPSQGGGVSSDASTCVGTGSPWLLFDLFAQSSSGYLGGIYAMRADGSAGHSLILPSMPALYPSVSADGSHLLFVNPADLPDGGGQDALFLYDLATHSARQVASGSTLLSSALSPDGQTVAYTAGLDIRVVGADGTGDRLLLQGPAPEDCAIGGYGAPVFLGNSRTILYGTAGTVGRIDIDGSNQADLLSEEDWIVLFPNAALSPDGLSVGAFTACDPSANEGTLRVYPYASLPAPCASGRPVTQAEQSSFGNESNNPTWSATGMIAFAQVNDVYVVDPDGGAVTNMTATLTGDGGVADDPAWAPPCAEIP
jgi:Tol biopolymer transport system component